MPSDGFLLGAFLDDAGQRSDEPATIDPADLTTHGTIVGMTGSGKTGLGMVLLEEALAAGVPVLAIDPKGDLGNLALVFPDLSAAEFEPWIDAAQAQRDGTTVAAAAESTARTWREGLSSWGIDGERLRALRDAAPVTVYTPGSTAGVGLDLVGGLERPADYDPDRTADEIEGYVSGLLGLVDIDANPLTSREHILLSNLVHHAWSEGTDLDLPTLIGQVQAPPLRKLGILQLDEFFPAQDRTQLAMSLNGLLASPSFAAWSAGVPCDIDGLLGEVGAPRAAVVTLAHLDDAERQFVVSLLLGKLITWMRRQPGTGTLRALVYIDEVMGLAPPTANPPAKTPILTILKQARAHGVGMVLSTQNPVDLDYKAVSNSGTWMIGRLQTEQDQARLMDGLRATGGGTDASALAATIAGLDRRQFVLHQAGGDAPRRFTTRWAMSYLRGPLTLEEIAGLRGEAGADTPARPSAPDELAAELADDESPLPPTVESAVAVRYVTPSTPWLDQVGARAGGRRLRPALVATVHLLFDERSADDLRHTETWEAIIPIDGTTADPAAAVPVDHDPRDLTGEAPSGAVHVLTEAELDSRAWWSSAASDLKAHLRASEVLELQRNTELALISRPGETAEAFRARCEQAADEGADAAARTIRERIEKKMATVQRALAQAERRAAELEVDVQSRRNDEMVGMAGSLLSTFLGGRRSARSIGSSVRGASSRRSQTQRTSARLESAAERVADKADDLAALEDELADALADIEAEWTAKVDAVEPFPVPLEAADITVQQLDLLWLPTD